MSFVREHKWLLILVVISLMAIGVGVFFIKQTEYQQQQDQKLQDQKQLDLYNQMATQAAQNLMETVAHNEQSIDDIIPESSLAKVKAMEGKIPETGTEDWCELMMTKNADAWTEDEQAQFAQHCI